jgi:hypothetical protein
MLISDEQMQRLRTVKAKHESELMRKANVVGVGIGLRERGGEMTDEPSIVVSVTRKLPSYMIDPEDLIPRELDGVPVDVQAVGKLQAFAGRLREEVGGINTRELAQAKQVKETHTVDLLKKRNVVGIGLGHKISEGRNTGELSLVVSVARKVPKTALSAQDLVPRAVDGIRTDVVETGILRALWERPQELGPRDRWRPVVPPGVSIGHYKITAGTFGCLVLRGEELFILSNNHVLANANDCEEWDPILQPGPADGGTEEDRIARLARYVPIEFESGPSECSVADFAANLLNYVAGALGSRHQLEPVKRSAGVNRVDAALGKPLSPNMVTNEILGIGVPTGVATAALGTQVQKSGRTTGHTQGTITQVDATVRIDYYGPQALFTGQVVASPMSQGGDSGSAILDMDRCVVGLLFAGSDAVTILNPIDEVLSALEVELAI